MKSFIWKNLRSNNYLNDKDNINCHLINLSKPKKDKKVVQNKIKEIGNKVRSKGKNANNSKTLSQKTKKNLFENINSGKTEQNNKIFLNRKRKHDKTDEENNENNLDNKNLEEKENIIVNIRGRRKKNVEYDSKPKHDKFNEDNIMQKIKKSIFYYILDNLNKSLKYEIYKFYPLTKEININLKKDFNEKLLNRTIRDIYMKSDLNKRYININDLNRTLIKKIYAQKIEKDTINILDKKFKEILDYIREKDLDNFLTEFRNREIKNDDKLIDKYMKAVKKMLIKYEFWFKLKLERKQKKKKKIKKLNSSYKF